MKIIGILCNDYNHFKDYISEIIKDMDSPSVVYMPSCKINDDIYIPIFDYWGFNKLFSVNRDVFEFRIITRTAKLLMTEICHNHYPHKKGVDE